jgi:hypothetical protein
METELESKEFKTWLSDNIIYTEVKLNAIIDLEAAKNNTEMVRKLSGEKKYPLLVDLNNIKSITKEARDHFAMKGREPLINSLAMVIKSPISRMIGNYFINLSSPIVPTKLFNSKEKAIKWLTPYIHG